MEVMEVCVLCPDERCREQIYVPKRGCLYFYEFGNMSILFNSPEDRKGIHPIDRRTKIMEDPNYKKIELEGSHPLFEVLSILEEKKRLTNELNGFWNSRSDFVKYQELAPDKIDFGQLERVTLGLLGKEQFETDTREVIESYEEQLRMLDNKLEEPLVQLRAYVKSLNVC